ncbi:hypothetical protein CTAM01_15300 [Colletotrichum tamarilloi]|uniref:Luciferase domain-containing protein n=1 Tax=Colletotrichum tamarilloi TaxID=1209934 RepID=A0ABQ9QLZ6_9PEZI|nr:uncharacterized protein CTAM01_15300 [Colletotrichum tamarilloi]KAK1476949.1 hypothetical protein CTAM01_15300 [Colletotrichum tamarilloi]
MAQNSSMVSHQATQSGNSSNSMDQAYGTDAMVIWKKCVHEASQEDALVIAVVHPKQEQRVKDSRRSMPKSTCARRIFICGPSALQDIIEQEVNNKRRSQFTQLHIVVSSAIESIYYQVTSVIKEFNVRIYGAIRGNIPCKLLVDEKSTFCDVPVHRWGYDRVGSHVYLPDPGIYYPALKAIADLMQSALNTVCFRGNTAVTVEEEEKLAKIERKMSEFQKSSGTSASAESSTPDGDDPRGGRGGLDTLKALFAAIIGLASTTVGAGGVIWANMSGVFISGPLGFFLATGHFSAGVAGAAYCAGVGLGAAAAGSTYLIDWAQLWRWLRAKLAWAWEKIAFNDLTTHRTTVIYSNPKPHTYNQMSQPSISPLTTLLNRLNPLLHSLRNRSTLPTLLTTLATPLLLWAAYRDYRAYIALGPGGVPHNALGWLLVTLGLRPFALSKSSATWTGDYPDHGSHAEIRDLPERKGERAELGGIVPHRQLSQHAPEKMRGFIENLFANAVTQNPSLLTTKLSLYERNNPALFLHPQILSSLSSSSSSTPVIARGEIAHHHTDLSIHLYLSPADAKLAIQKRWAERHRLSLPKGSFLANRLHLADSYLMVYGPRDEEEMEVLAELLRCGVRFMTGKEDVGVIEWRGKINA